MNKHLNKILALAAVGFSVFTFSTSGNAFKSIDTNASFGPNPNNSLTWWYTNNSRPNYYYRAKRTDSSIYVWNKSYNGSYSYCFAKVYGSYSDNYNSPRYEVSSYNGRWVPTEVTVYGEHAVQIANFVNELNYTYACLRITGNGVSSPAGVWKPDM